MKKYLPLILLIVLFQAVGALMGYLTVQDIEPWYNGLNRSPFNPPPEAFRIIWPLLYVALAVAGWLVWQLPQSDERKTLLTVFGAHMLMNWAWTPVFFTAKLLLPGFILLLAIVATALWLFKRLWNPERRAAFLLVPYIAWVSYASYLNFYVWMHN
ncbi:MAG: TspO/MBR family protein [Micavibrio sp.]